MVTNWPPSRELRIGFEHLTQFEEDVIFMDEYMLPMLEAVWALLGLKDGVESELVEDFRDWPALGLVI
jgi:hypothetical protein